MNPSETRSVAEVEKQFETSCVSGLSQHEVQKRFDQSGANTLSAEKVTWWRILLRQFSSPFLYLLIGAALIAAVLGESLDAVFIFVFIAINVGLGFYQEFRSDYAFRLLRSFIASQETVRRNGKTLTIDSRELVPGDVLLLKAGDIVPADLRLCESTGLEIDESTLTGETVPVHKQTTSLRKEAAAYHQSTNMAWSGTTVLSGSAVGIVVATGDRSALGKIATLSKETIKESEFFKGMNQYSQFILRIVIVTLLVIFIAKLILGMGTTNMEELIIFSIALAISIIPEALPVVSIFSLSRGALRLAKKHVVVKRLTAIEDLGGITVLCTDKTGTLTENELRVADVLLQQDDRDELLIEATAGGEFLENPDTRNPFDRALILALTKAQKHKLEEYQPISELPFDPKRRRNSAIVASKKHTVLVVRGAPEEVMNLCIDGKKTAERSQSWIEEQGIEGRRILAIAIKTLPKDSKEIEANEHHLELLGLVSFEDQIKKTTFAAVKQAQALGVKIKILTGDAPEVAGAVAHKIGLAPNPKQVLTATDLLSKPMDEQKHLLETYAVFARVSPEQKYQIVSLLQQSHTVGLLGEGVNDAPALKVAGVSIVVSNASGVAREAADIILLQKSLHVIVEGIKEGREIFSNTLKYIRATLSSNFGNFYAVAISSLFIPYLPMLPVQILLLNLLSDFPMISVAADTVDQDDLKKPQSYRIRDIALIVTLLGLVSTFFDFLVFALYFRSSPELLQTTWFVVSVLTELAFLFSVRTKKFAFFAKRPAGIVILLTTLAAIIALSLPFTSVGQTIFKFIPLSTTTLLSILSLVVLYFIATEATKLLYYRFLGNNVRQVLTNEQKSL